MICSSFPIEENTGLVADASVLINLNATGYAEAIVEAVRPCRVLVTDSALGELIRGGRNGHRDGDIVQGLVQAQALRPVALGDRGSQIYSSLVDGSASSTLDDGEAATIGHAFEIDGVALIDERKALGICQRQFPELRIASTVDFLLHQAVRAPLAKKAQAEAIRNALLKARMRVPPHRIDVVVGLIGKKAATSCSSLPRAALVGSAR